jgi:hypothetical protein
MPVVEIDERHVRKRRYAKSPACDDPSLRPSAENLAYVPSVDWLVSSTASHHIMNDPHYFQQGKYRNQRPTPYYNFQTFIRANNIEIPVAGVGTVSIEVFVSTPASWPLRPVGGSAGENQALALKPDTVCL